MNAKVCRRLRAEARKLYDWSELRYINSKTRLDSLFGFNVEGTIKWSGNRRFYQDLKNKYKNGYFI